MSILNFNKNRKVYTVIKMLKVVNFEQSKQFNLKKCYKLCSEFFEDNIGAFPNSNSINYQNKTWKTYKGFLKGISNKKDSDIVWLYSGFNDEKDQNVFTITNTLMNFENPPDGDIIEVTISIDSAKVNSERILKFFKEIYVILNFDYAFTLELDERYDFAYERKIKRKLFSISVESKEIDVTWKTSQIGIQEGFIKKLYKFNIINNSHLQQPVIKELIKQCIGNLEKLNDKLTIWRLDNDQFEIAKERLNNSKYVIYNESKPDLFLHTEEAKRFHDLMKLK